MQRNYYIYVNFCNKDERLQSQVSDLNIFISLIYPFKACNVVISVNVTFDFCDEFSVSFA